MPVLSMLLASPISPPMAATLLGGQVSASWAGQMVSRNGLRAGPCPPQTEVEARIAADMVGNPGP
jgi:hypothetical protein